MRKAIVYCLWLGSVLISCWAIGVTAQTTLPLSVANFVADKRASIDVSAVVHSDLGRSGYFNMIDSGAVVADIGPVPAELKAKGIDMLVSGSVSRLADGRFNIRYRLNDLVKQRAVFHRSMVVHPDDLRMDHRLPIERKAEA